MDIGHLVHPEWMPVLEDPTIKNTLETPWAWAKERQTHVAYYRKKKTGLRRFLAGQATSKLSSWGKILP